MEIHPNPVKSGITSITDHVELNRADITDKLNLFEPIFLEQMDDVRLLDRLDTKFVFHQELLPELLEQMKEDYFILEIAGKRISRYETRYFDTIDFRYYTHHHNGKLNRFKFRFRKYLDSGTTFFEVKLKNNKGRIIKKRVQVEDIGETISGLAQELLMNKAHIAAGLLTPSLDIHYSRMTFVNRKTTERLTIDLDLQYTIPGKEKIFPALVIAEAKQDKTTVSLFTDMMHQRHIRSLSISKYCLGIASLVDGIKTNNFKFKINTVNSINHVH
jgi:hypothetical protein